MNAHVFLIEKMHLFIWMHSHVSPRKYLIFHNRLRTNISEWTANGIEKALNHLSDWKVTTTFYPDIYANIASQNGISSERSSHSKNSENAKPSTQPNIYFKENIPFNHLSFNTFHFSHKKTHLTTSTNFCTAVHSKNGRYINSQVPISCLH